MPFFLIITGVEFYSCMRYKVCSALDPDKDKEEDVLNRLTAGCPVRFKEGFVFDVDVCDIDGGAT
jgi:hypothetical protein